MFRITGLVTVLAAALVFTLVVAPASSAQGIKIGFVKEERIQQEYKGWQRAQEEWDTDSKAWEDEAVSMQQELQDLMDEYDKQKLILSDEKKREREAAINVKKDALDTYTRTVFGPGGRAEVKHDQLLQPILENIQRAIEEVAIEGNYDVIYTLQSIAYIKDSYDVTDEVLTKLEEIE